MNDLDLYSREDDSLTGTLVAFTLIVLMSCTATVFLYLAARGEPRPVTVGEYATKVYAEAKVAEARKVAAEAERLARLPDPGPVTLAAVEVASEPWKLPARPDCDRPRLASTPRARVRKPRPKPSRRLRYRRINADVATLDIVVGKDWFSYYLARLACDFEGFLAVRLTKCRTQQRIGEPASYDVLLDTLPVSDGHPADLSECECLGFLRHRHCKHLDAVRAIANVLAKE